jgi:Ca2+-binding RTX toxin-like protein
MRDGIVSINGVRIDGSTWTEISHDDTTVYVSRDANGFITHSYVHDLIGTREIYHRLDNGEAVTSTMSPLHPPTALETTTEREWEIKIGKVVDEFYGDDTPPARGVGEVVIGSRKYQIETALGTGSKDDLAGSGLLAGGAGADTLTGGAQRDILKGNADADTLEGRAGGDLLDGGAGYDFATYYAATSGVLANLSNSSGNTGDAAGDMYIDIEGLGGSAYADVLIGNGGSNELHGHKGNDELIGLGGNDYLYGGDGWDSLEGDLGADVLDGGAGFDFATFYRAASGVVASLSNAATNSGAAAGDTYAGIEGLGGSSYSDVLTGNGGYNELFGHNGNDQLYGLGDGDFLSGGEGHDQLFGGAGSDWLTGGNGADWFHFDTARGAGNVDVVNDFTKGQDMLVLSRSVFTAFGPGTPGATVILAYAGSYAFTTGSAATSTFNKIIYNSATGDLFYDADGTGSIAQVKFATVSKGLALSANDFMLI